MGKIDPSIESGRTPSKLLARRLVELGLHAVAIDDTITAIALGPRGDEIMRELAPEAARRETPSGHEIWMFANVTFAAQVEEFAEQIAALLPRYPELRKRFH